MLPIDTTDPEVPTDPDAPPTDPDRSEDAVRADASPVQPGDVLDGKYRVERVLGIGGMGVVVAATNIAIDQRVALKFMLPHALANKDAVARFVREARAAGRLRSEHVARVLDVGTLPNGAPYIVMEFLDGVDLATKLRDRGRLVVEDAVAYVVQAIDAIAEAHSLGIVHRDLKPANLFVTKRSDGAPFVKVLDFGISKAQLSAEALTATATLMGSPGYMSPEQMRESRSVDPRTDIWALGVVLYELVAGRLPYVAESMPELILKILEESFEPLTATPGVPAELARIVHRCLEKDRDRRYANVAELACVLEPFASPRERGTAARAATVLGVEVDRGALAAPAIAKPARTAPRIVLGVGGGLAIGLAVTIVVATRRHEQAPAVVAAADIAVIVDASPQGAESPEVKLVRYRACWDAFNANDEETFVHCYAADAIREEVDSVPEVTAQGPDAIRAVMRRQKAAFPDLRVTPQLAVVSGRTIAAILHVTGTRDDKHVGLFEAQIAVLGDDGMFTRDSLYVDQPTIFHQLGLMPNDSSPAALVTPPVTTIEVALSRSDDHERANKALVEGNIEAVNNKDANAIEPVAADDIHLTYHGDKALITTKRAYRAWFRDTLRATRETKVDVKGIWAAGDIVAVADVFTGIPISGVIDQDTAGKRVETQVVQFFRIRDGKIREHHIFANRFKTAVQLGVLDPEQITPLY